MAGDFVSASSEYIDLSSHAASLQTAQGSLSLWFKTSTQSKALIGCGQSGGTGGSMLFVGNSTGTYADESLSWFGDFNTMLCHVRLGHSFYTDDVWHNVIVVMDASDNRIYVDGVKQTLTFENGGLTTANAFLTDATFNVFYIGMRQNSTLHFDGQLADVRIYNSNKYINDSEAATIYHSRGNDNITTGLVARWLMNEQPTGSTMTSAIDIGGNGYDGSLTTAPDVIDSPHHFIK